MHDLSPRPPGSNGLGVRRATVSLPRWVLLAAALACSGDGPSGPPDDRTPPPAPQLSLINVQIPVGGQTTVRGDVAAVEGRSTVLVENLTAKARTGGQVLVEARASVDGAFVARLPAVLGDELSILARDDAGNVGPAVRLLAGPNVATFRLSALSGSGQVGVVSRPLTDPLRVRVQGGVPPFDIPDVTVTFEIAAGTGNLSTATATTDSGGVAGTVLTLGEAPGLVEVHARVAGVDQVVTFEATATGPPEIAAVTPDRGERGSTVTILGRNFSPIAEHDFTEFNRVEAEVLSASETQLSVAVPTFASDGPVTVTLTGVRSNGLPFKVEGPPPVVPEVGSVELARLGPGPGGSLSGEVGLKFPTGNEEYVVAVEALSSDRATFTHALASDAGVLPDIGEDKRAALGSAQGQARMDALLRAWEAEIARSGKARARPSGARLAGEPQIGDRQSFHAINTSNPLASPADPANFDSVSAVLRFKGAHTLIFVDERVPALDLTDDDVRAVGERFDTQTYAIDRDAFGEESDIDGDGRVTILLTPTVNSLNRGARPEEGIVIGFFFSLDLVPAFSPTTSNGREMFYGFVPDPGGRFGPPIPRDFVIPTLEEIFAHELQHMISFNQHVLVRGGQSEDLWLNEGLSHIAEDLNGFDEGNEIRSALYLSAPNAAGLAVSGGGNALEERGASFLFLRHLGDQRGAGVFRSLVETNLTGVANVTNATMEGFGNLFSDWFAALFLDDIGIGDPGFQIPSLTLRATYEQVRASETDLGLGPYLAIRGLSVPDGSVSSATVGTAGTFYDVTTTRGTAERKLSVTASLSSQAQITVIRAR